MMLWWFAGLCALCAAAAGYAAAHGNPTGWSGVAGAGTCAVVFVVFALVEGRQ